MLFELIAERYERRSLALTANQPFSAWDSPFPDAAMTLAAVDRLVQGDRTTGMISSIPSINHLRLCRAAGERLAPSASDDLDLRGSAAKS